ARLFLRQGDAGEPPEGERMAKIGNAVDAELETRLVEEHVTGAHEGFVDVDRSVSFLPPALVDASAEGKRTGAEKVCLGIDHARFKSRGRKQRLVGGARRILARDRAVLERPALVAGQGTPSLR